ncbi:hypothetical protein FRC17_001225 [Serendipita sp. 399]|nr:hypothetical protein FRC17_001225 [Serendipita sp. 399]
MAMAVPVVNMVALQAAVNHLHETGEVPVPPNSSTKASANEKVTTTVTWTRAHGKSIQVTCVDCPKEGPGSIESLEGAVKKKSEDKALVEASSVQLQSKKGFVRAEWKGKDGKLIADTTLPNI